MRAGVLSAGAWSESSHLPVLAADDRVDLVTMSRPDRREADRIGSRFGIEVVTTDWRAALDEDLDIVVVSSPPVGHLEQVVSALGSGAHVLVEKPFALNSEDARTMRDAAVDAGRGLLVGFGWACVPIFQHVEQLIRAGDLGDLELAVCHLAVNNRGLLAGQVTEAWAGSGRYDPSTYIDPGVSGGGAAAVAMSHQFGLVAWMLGDIASVDARTVPTSTSVDLHDASLLRFSSGAVGCMSCASTHPHPIEPQWTLHLYGTDGQLFVDTERNHARVVDNSGTITELPLEADASVYRAGGPTVALIECGLGAEVPEGLSGRVGVVAVDAVAALYASASLCAEVEIR